MYKKFLLINSLGKEVLKAAKSYYRGGGKTIKLSLIHISEPTRPY